MALLVGASGCSGDPEVPVGVQLPSEPVEILIDDRGIPHIYANNDEDLFFAYGYQIASDRMLQLEMFRRFAHGQLSEVLGPEGPGSAGANTLVDDRFARIFNWKHWGQLDAALMKEQEPEHYKLTSAWVAGINKRVAEINGGQVPLPFGFGADAIDFKPSPWTLDDPYIVQKMAGFGLDQTIQFEVFVTFTNQFAEAALDAIQLFKPAHPVFTVPDADKPAGSSAMSGGLPANWGGFSQPGRAHSPQQQPAFGALKRLSHMKPLGSNNWSVAGEHTANGMPIIAGDPHLGYDFSGTTYSLHLSSKEGTSGAGSGSFDITGFSFVGAPGIFAGHNDRIAYTPTSAFADVMDMWSVTIEDGNAHIGGELVPTTQREETIAIRDGEPDVITVTDVPGYGVIMPSSLVGSPLPIAGSGKEVLIGWTGFKARPARYFRELMRAESIDEFDEAVLRLPEMTYNFMAADASGITYRVGVDVPERNPIAAGREPFRTMDADDPQSFWPGGMLSKDLMPNSRGADRGWLATANNDPFGFTADGDVSNDPFYYGAIFPPGWRAKRIEDEVKRLVADGGITVADMQTLQMDVHSNAADDILPIVAEVWSNAQSDSELAEYAQREDLATLVAALEGWDKRMARDSSGAVVFHAFAHFAAAEILEDDLSPLLYEVVLTSAPMYLLKITALALKGEYPDPAGVMQEGRDLIVLQALDATAAYLTQRFGGVDPSGYTFADVRVSSMDDAYGRGMPLVTLPTDGGESTVNVAQSVFRKDGNALDQWVSHWGPIERQVTSFDANGVPQAESNFPLGNVADPMSPHFDDAMTGWTNGDYSKMLFARDEVEAAEQRRVVLPAATASP